jgi:uncharacterized protein YkuJ
MAEVIWIIRKIERFTRIRGQHAQFEFEKEDVQRIAYSYENTVYTV